MLQGPEVGRAGPPTVQYMGKTGPKGWRLQEERIKIPGQTQFAVPVSKVNPQSDLVHGSSVSQGVGQEAWGISIHPWKPSGMHQGWRNLAQGGF